MIRTFKPLYIAVLGAVVLSSCGSLKNAAVPSMNTAVYIEAKKGAIGDEEFNHWAHADLATDTIPGISLDKAYTFLEGKTGETVIVGVIDSGIDIEHEDLKDVVWTNTKEIAGNGIDDDKNGYVDDINGWNFLGGNGDPAPEQLEITRIVAKLNPKFEGKTATDIKEDDKEAFKQYQDYVKAYDASSKNYKQTMANLIQIEKAYEFIKEFLGKESDEIVTVEELENIKSEDQRVNGVRGGLLGLAENGIDEAEFIEYYEGQKKSKNYVFNFDGRAIVGDNPEDINDVIYGNAHVIGSVDDEMHGTHVSGIILASRNNGKGMNGVAHNAKLMAIRTVPDGDERDKDVALAIRYAVDNGAKVVNMSFGKSFSPNRQWVFDALKYAEEKDVLLVHAAGNDNKNIDKSNNWPSDSADKISELVGNVITVGAIGSSNDENLPATFSNYGILNVDVFAPGVQIYSTVPKNEYEKVNGTSMAAPEVSGIAALVRSYYPQLSAKQVKHIIMNSATKMEFDVVVPGKPDEKVDFAKLSVTGGIANAYNALVLAHRMVNSN